MLKVLKVFAVTVFAFLAFVSSASAREFADIYSDCGIGAIIAPRNSGVAAATNVTWDSGTTAISSNISSPDTCKGGQDRMAAFIYESYPSLEGDLASGHGAYLDTMLSLTGVDAQNQLQLTQAIRNDFAVIVADSDYSEKSQFEKAETLFNVIYKHVDA